MKKILIILIALVLLGGFGFARADFEPRGPEFIGPPPLQIQNITTSPTPIEQTDVEAAIPNPAPAAPPAITSDNTPTPTQDFVPPPTGKIIYVSLKTQDLKYYQDGQLVGEFLISSGIKGMPTPPGDYTVLVKKPVVDFKGPGYDFPNTKWNLMFKKNTPLNYYIHGAYWHHNFGHPMSHGCINVSYANMEGLYNWADVGTPIVIE